MKRPYTPKDLPVEYRQPSRKELPDIPLGIIVAALLAILMPIYCVLLANVLAS